jgi:hypothetical protein
VSAAIDPGQAARLAPLAGRLCRVAGIFGTPAGRYRVVAVMTLLLVVLHTHPAWYVQAGVMAIALAGLLHPPAIHRPAFWFGLVAVLSVGLVRLWYEIDNHQYLITYWCFAIGVTRLAAEPERALALNARLLVGLAFLLATIWKLATPEYVSGAFFEGLMLTDPRFADVARLAGAENLAAGQHALRDFSLLGDPEAGVSLTSSARLAALAGAMTWWTVGIEALVAAAFLWPGRRGLPAVRDQLLVAFLATTYLLAPVVGFAWVLAAMGAAQTRLGGRGVLVYLAVFVLVKVAASLPIGRAALAIAGF